MTGPDPNSVDVLDGDGPVCAGCDDLDLWFDPDRAHLARSLCRSCPVQAACLTGAVRRGEEWGVWGGRLFQPDDQTATRPVAAAVPAAADSPVAVPAVAASADADALAVVVVPLRPSKPHRPSEAALRARPRVAAALAVLRAERAAGAAGGPEAA